MSRMSRKTQTTHIPQTTPIDRQKIPTTLSTSPTNVSASFPSVGQVICPLVLSLLVSLVAFGDKCVKA